MNFNNLNTNKNISSTCSKSGIKIHETSAYSNNNNSNCNSNNNINREVYRQMAAKFTVKTPVNFHNTFSITWI